MKKAAEVLLLFLFPVRELTVEGIPSGTEMCQSGEWGDKGKMFLCLSYVSILSFSAPLGCCNFLIVLQSSSKDIIICGQLLNCCFCGGTRAETLLVHHLADITCIPTLTSTRQYCSQWGSPTPQAPGVLCDGRLGRYLNTLPDFSFLSPNPS